MRKFLRGLGATVAILVVAAGSYVWYELSPESYKSVAIPLIIIGVAWHLLNIIVVQPMKYEFNELHRRLDVIEGRNPRPSIFD